LCVGWIPGNGIILSQTVSTLRDVMRKSQETEKEVKNEANFD
jgi:hypothetical protein